MLHDREINRRPLLASAYVDRLSCRERCHARVVAARRRAVRSLGDCAAVHNREAHFVVGTSPRRDDKPSLRQPAEPVLAEIVSGRDGHCHRADASIGADDALGRHLCQLDRIA